MAALNGVSHDDNVSDSEGNLQLMETYRFPNRPVESDSSSGGSADRESHRRGTGDACTGSTVTTIAAAPSPLALVAGVPVLSGQEPPQTQPCSPRASAGREHDHSVLVDVGSDGGRVVSQRGLRYRPHSSTTTAGPETDLSSTTPRSMSFGLRSRRRSTGGAGGNSGVTGVFVGPPSPAGVSGGAQAGQANSTFLIDATGGSDDDALLLATTTATTPMLRKAAAPQRQQRHAPRRQSQPPAYGTGGADADTNTEGRGESLSFAVGDDPQVIGRRTSNPEALVALEEIVKDGPAPYSATAASASSSNPFFTQLLALLRRTVQQMWRSRLSLLAELIVPLVFIALIAVLDAAFGAQHISAWNPLDTELIAYQANANDYLLYMCYDDAGGYPPIGNYQPCSRYGDDYVDCSGDESGLPVQGVCLLKFYLTPLGAIASFVGSFEGSLIAVPPLDAIISNQWIAKKIDLATDSRSRTALAALSSVGLGVSASTRYDSISSSGRLLFAPRANVPQALIDYFSTESHLFQYVNGGVFETVDDAEAYARQYSGDTTSADSIWGIVVVNDITDSFDVTIQLRARALPPLRPTVEVTYRDGFTFDGTDMYLASGYVSIQRMLYDYFFQSQREKGVIAAAYDPSTVYPMAAAFPSIRGERRYMVSLAGPLVAFIVVLSFLYPFFQMTKRLVLEKELRIREAMLIMGLRRSALWSCFFLVTFVQLLCTSILVTLLLCLTVIKRSNPFVVFLMIFTYACTLIPLVGLTSTFFSKARLSALMSPLIYFVLSMLIFAMVNAGSGVSIGLSIFSPTALAVLMSAVVSGEAGRGFAPSDLRGNPLYIPQPYKVLLMMMGDFFIYALLMFYLDAVMPQEWGSTRHPLFFVLDPYRAIRDRCCRRQQQQQQQQQRRRRGGGSFSSDDAGGDRDGGAAGGRRSTMSNSQKSLRFDSKVGIDALTGKKAAPTVELQDLVKRYKRGGKPFTAVNRLSWELYPNEISILLGPNGSGKSTAVNMLTGMTQPDSGSCTVAGYSVERDVDKARHEIGFCPQHNILWPDLTCREHLEFFGRIKGLSGAPLEDAVTDVLRAVDLSDKINYLPSALSGGQRRKLSVAIAFVGRSRTVLLDEPTAGMDAGARRHTWSLLRAMAPNRTILLTTHYMDEADLLGDQIAIISDGTLRCAGSSLFLRSRAGSGYTLRFDLLPLSINALQSVYGTRRQRLRRKWDTIAEKVRGCVPQATLTLQTNSEMVFCIPLSLERRLPQLLKALERRGNRELGIRSYALSAPTLEDVFMNIVQTAAAEDAEAAATTTTTSTTTKTADSSIATRAGTVGPQGSTVPRRTSDVSGSKAAILTSTSAEVPGAVDAAGAPRAPDRSAWALRRMSRGSIRFVSGEDPEAPNMTAFPPYGVDSNSGTNDDDDDDDGGGGAGLSTGALRSFRCGDPLALDGEEQVSGAVGGGSTLPKRRGTVQLVLPDGSDGEAGGGGGGGGGECPTREDVASIASAGGMTPYNAGLMMPMVLSTTTDAAFSRQTWSQASPGDDRGRRRASASNATGASGDSLDDVFRPLQSAAAAADAAIEQVWQVQPVRSTASLRRLQLEATLYKRLFYALRDHRMQFFQVVCPVLCILLAMLLQLVNSQYTGTVVLDAAGLFHGLSEFDLSNCAAAYAPIPELETYYPSRGQGALQFDDTTYPYGSDFCHYLADSWFRHDDPRYGAIQCRDPILRTILEWNFPSTLLGKNPFVVFYNTSSRHSLPFAMATAYQLMYYSALHEAGVPTETIRDTAFQIAVRPLPLDNAVKEQSNALSSILIGVIVLIPFTFLPANPVAWVVKERESNARHLQKLSGLPYLLYWAGNIIFDFTAYIVSATLVIIVFLIFRRWEYVGADAIGPLILSLLLYGLCYCSGAYAVSFFFAEHTAAQVAVMGVSFVAGFVCVVLVFVLSMLEWTESASDALRWVFRVIPSYSIGEVILGLALLKQNRLMHPDLGPWSMTVTGWADIYMAAEVPLFVAVTLLWDHPQRPACVDAIKQCFRRLCCCCCGGGDAGAAGQQHNPTMLSPFAGRPEPPNAAERPMEPSHEPHSCHHPTMQQSPVWDAGHYDPASTTAPDTQPHHRHRHHPAAAPDAAGGGGSSSGEATDRQRRAAEAEHLCRLASFARRQPLWVYPASEPFASNRVLFEPAMETWTQQSAALPSSTSAHSPYGGEHTRKLSNTAMMGSPVAPPPGGAAVTPQQQRRLSRAAAAVDAAAGGGGGGPLRQRASGAVPALAVADLIVSRDTAPTAAGGGVAGRAVVASSPGAVVVPIPGAGSPPPPHIIAAAAARGPDAPREPLCYMYPAVRVEAADYENRAEEDSDVEDERAAVYHDERSPGHPDVVRLVDLRKVYPNGKVALRGLSFGVMPGEVFGFLGTNGAGKTTAISILSQEQRPSSGRAYVCGHDVVQESGTAMRCLGYCPQFDACFDLLTVEEHLIFYARVRGVEAAARAQLVANLLSLCGLTLYRKVLSHELSGGNRRKLSVAIALLGAPKVVCLDEPSAGMDPIARRLLWRTLDRVSKKCAIVLTSHHLEEVEALADTVAIMVDGGLRCIGDLPHLKNKYAKNAYELSIRVAGARGGGGNPPRRRSSPSAEGGDDADEGETSSTARRRSSTGTTRSFTYGGADFVVDDDDDVAAFMAKHLPSALLIENFSNERYVYSIPATRDVARAMAALKQQMQHHRASFSLAPYADDASCSRSATSTTWGGASASVSAATARAMAAAKIVRLSEVFRLLQEHQVRLGITEYSVAQVSLEQVFLRVTNSVDAAAAVGPQPQQRRQSRRWSSGSAAVAGRGGAPPQATAVVTTVPPTEEHVTPQAASSPTAHTAALQQQQQQRARATPLHRVLRSANQIRRHRSLSLSAATPFHLGPDGSWAGVQLHRGASSPAAQSVASPGTFAVYRRMRARALGDNPRGPENTNPEQQQQQWGEEDFVV